MPTIVGACYSSATIDQRSEISEMLERREPDFLP